MHRRLLGALIVAVLAGAPLASAGAFDLEQALRSLADGSPGFESDLSAVQGGGKSLSEAIEQVRRRTGGRIVSAETRISGGREVHYIKVLTKDGKVKTHKVNGRKVKNR